MIPPHKLYNRRVTRIMKLSACITELSKTAARDGVLSHTTADSLLYHAENLANTLLQLKKDQEV